MLKNKKTSVPFILEAFFVIFGIISITHFYHEYHLIPKHEAINSLKENVINSLGKSKAASDLCKIVEKSAFPKLLMDEVLKLLSESSSLLAEIKNDTAITREASDAIISLKEWNSKLYVDTRSTMKCPESMKTSDEIDKWGTEIIKKINDSKKWY